MFDIEQNENEYLLYYKSGDESVLINNVTIRKFHNPVTNKETEDLYELETLDHYSTLYLMEFSVTDFPYITKFYFSSWEATKNYYCDLEIIYWHISLKNSLPLVKVHIFFDDNLLKNYNFTDYKKIFLRILSENFIDYESFSLSLEYKELTQIAFEIHQEFGFESLDSEPYYYKRLIHETDEKTIQLLKNRFRRRRLTNRFRHRRHGQNKTDEKTIQLLTKQSRFETYTGVFSFPANIKIPCEQYLLYFAQFLQDLGSNATSNLKEEAGKVLFSITPTDDLEALDKIREALAIYLSLPSNPISGSTGDKTVDMVLSGARANIKHLESQLELAIAKIQFKDATLELKDATIEQNKFALRQRDERIKELKEIVSRGNIFQESLERVEINGEVIDEKSLYRFSREDDIEVKATPILDEKNEETKIGLVKFHEVSKLKDYGVTFDLPKAIRGLIDYFKRDKSSR